MGRYVVSGAVTEDGLPVAVVIVVSAIFVAPSPDSSVLLLASSLVYVYVVPKVGPGSGLMRDVSELEDRRREEEDRCRSEKMAVSRKQCEGIFLKRRNIFSFVETPFCASRAFATMIEHIHL